MNAFVDFIQSFGGLIITYAGVPLLLWTVIAGPVTFLLYRAKSISAIYQYHLRLTLLVTLPLSFAGSILIDMLHTGTQSAGSLSILVIQNPIPVTTVSSQSPTISGLADPIFWMGLLGLILVAGTIILLLKTALNLHELRKLKTSLNFKPLSHYSELRLYLPKMEKGAQNVRLAFSNEAAVPYTFGWYNTRIVVPTDLKNNSQNLAMAVQHELAHVRHYHFLFNGITIIIKALFWFHPLVHYLHNSGREYREIICDSRVLTNEQFSKKQYAMLLFELAKREQRSEPALSMAVNPSTLKKRIQIMSSETNFSDKLHSSLLLTVTLGLLVTITISCTDMAQDGVTKSELRETQSKIKKQPAETNPLYVVNGELWGNEASAKEKLARLKPKYIENIEVLKGQKATEQYGNRGENGVIKIEILNPEKAFSDLGPAPTTTPQITQNGQEDNLYISVDNMPKLKGGLASLQRKINYPESAQEAGIEGRVIVQFIVNKQGEVEKPQIIKGIGGGCDKEALRVVKQAEFEPGTRNNGEAVRVQYSLPITYRLSSNTQG